MGDFNKFQNDFLSRLKSSIVHQKSSFSCSQIKKVKVKQKGNKPTKEQGGCYV